MVSSGGKLVAHGLGGTAYIPNHTKFSCGDTAPNIQQSSGHQAPPMRQNQKRLGKGRCNFFLAAWRGKCASACFIKPPVWAIVRKATAGTDKGEPRADLSIHIRIRRLVYVKILETAEAGVLTYAIHQCQMKLAQMVKLRFFYIIIHNHYINIHIIRSYIL